ncbi:MAG: phosphoglycerate mutase family protein [Proteobacteria bacterium]|nr:phosphoglycerate mutase family protein [Pseudomonadota bacterium]MDA1309807.1 phosphoglycerate mutase family protein [Pseudomonadota bacterium]
MSATIYLIRHGETTWNRIGRLQGQADSPLTLHGTRQAEAVGHALRPLVDGADFQFWASPLPRTRQTAAIICDVIEHDYETITFDDRLKEITLGDRDGYAGWRELARDFPKEAEIRRKDPWNFRHPNGESSQMVQDRVNPLLEHWKVEGGTHVVVSHGVAIKILRGLQLNLNEQETFALDRPQEAFHRLRDDGIEVIEVTLP